MRRSRAIRFREYVTPCSTGHQTRSTNGAMHFDVWTDREEHVVLKALNNEFGPRALANEMIGAELASRLGLPCPEPMVVDVPVSLPPVPLRCVPTPALLATGPSFGLPFLVGMSPINIHHVEQAAEPSNLSGIFVFDAWVVNRDRTSPGNLIATNGPRGRFVIWMIDHGHILTGPTWGPEDLAGNVAATAHPCPDVMLQAVLSLDRQVQRWVDTIRGLTAADLADVISTVPRAWLPDVEERRAVVEFLALRRDHLEEAVWTYLESLEPAGKVAV